MIAALLLEMAGKWFAETTFEAADVSISRVQYLLYDEMLLAIVAVTVLVEIN
ncbi:MAG: hypothetical protein JOZ78_15860 [Chroococcidiopsidaceae cyanobacterium CP_BM_ER_R8_30]|nr:hypothetical protein [Chroococcidiopsidaceae cyanobacterium CP_BM_ER_R8_30]